MTTNLKDYPAFNNMQVITQALGLAVDIETNDLLYASMAGPSTAVKSTWATICSKNSTLSCQQWHDEEMRGANPIKQVSVSLPNSHFKHVIAINHRPELLLVADPRAARYYDCLDVDHELKRTTLLQEQMASIYAAFANYINLYTEVPILTEWAEPMWRRVTGEGIRSLQAYGDCLGAWLVEADFDWTYLVQELLYTEAISLSEE